MIYPVLLCAVASASTVLGGVMVAFIKNMTPGLLAVFQGFAAGVMITISVVEMLPHSLSEFTYIMGMNGLYAVSAVVLIFICGWLAGIAIAAAADRLCRLDGTNNCTGRISFITTAVMVLHNLPEGMVTIFSGMEDAQMALGMALAVALHNIPEGVVVASSAMAVTNSVYSSMVRCFVAGFSEFAGGVIAAFIFRSMVNGAFVAAVYCAVSGVMMQVSLCELIPCGRKLSCTGHTAAGIAAGAVVIYLGLQLI